MTGKLFCTHCGAAYYRRDSKDRQGTVWRSGTYRGCGETRIMSRMLKQ